MQSVRVSTLKSPRSAWKSSLLIFSIASLLFAVLPARAATGGSITGAVTDPNGALISGAILHLTNTAQQTVYRAISDKVGLYSFPNLPVGHYDLVITATGFSSQEKTNLTVDTDAAMRVDVALLVGAQTDTVVVSDVGGVQVETVATHLGEVVSASQITALPLNGRSYTDLLAIQPGVAPVSTLLPSSVIMAGVTGGIDPSGDLNPGNLSINGQRESSNGFMVNGIDVQEHMNGGTSIIPEPRLDRRVPGPDQQLRSRIRQLQRRHRSPSSASPAPTHFTAMHSSSSATRPWTPEATSIPPARPSTRTSSAARSAARSSATRSSSSPTIREPAPRKVSPPATSRSPPSPSATATSTTSPAPVSGPYLASLLTQNLATPSLQDEPYTSVFPNGNIPQSAWSAPGKNSSAIHPIAQCRRESIFDFGLLADRPRR